MEDQFCIQNNVKVNQYQQKNSDITRTIFGIHWSNVHKYEGNRCLQWAKYRHGKKGKKLTNIRHNKEHIARTTHESRGYCTYQGPCQKQRQYQEKQGHYQVYKHIYSYIYQAKPHETYQVRVRRKTCLNQAQTVERH